MRAFATVLRAYMSLLCKALLVTPDFITKDRRGNLPPPSGGVGAF
jgi:hypothetical protein